ncbi:hypothetical protein FRB95_000858 [Tulasnella sp. JGI-2019a]|nr:hypothetical protein FRB93_000864 [Tulasnella sp. JGI-2019a]KAG9032924.1 hypothetical protein FRB95_000858 [Tulasnella sp. JGI-2019a]
MAMIPRLHPPKRDKLGRWIAAPSARPRPVIDPRLFDGCLSRFMDLPYEVQQLIIAEIQEHGLAKLVAVNRYMATLARPLLFRKIHIVEPDYGAISGVQRINRLNAFVAAVVSNPSLGPLVHTLVWSYPHDLTWKMLAILPNLRALKIWWNVNREKVNDPVDHLVFPQLTHLNVSGGFHPGALEALILGAPNIQSFIIHSDTYEFDPKTSRADPATIGRLVERCQQTNPPSLHVVSELHLDNMDPGFHKLNVLVRYLAPRVRTLTIGRDRRHEIVSWDDGLLSLLTSHEWKMLERLQAVDWEFSALLQDNIHRVFPDLSIRFPKTPRRNDEPGVRG